MKTAISFVAWVVALVGVSLFVVEREWLEAWKVPTDDPMLAASIEPQLSAGDVVLVWREPTFARGNLLRCPDPQAPGRYVIARAIAAPGDRLSIEHEHVSLDDRPIQSPRACEQHDYAMFDPGRNEDANLICITQEYGDRNFYALISADRPEPMTKIRPEGNQWFLVTDNRHIHVDSRDYGPIDTTGCRHIVFRLYGGDGFGDAKKRLSLVW
jgi:signal peptidase I